MNSTAIATIVGLGQSNGGGRPEAGADPDYTPDDSVKIYLPGTGLVTYNPGVNSCWDFFVGNTSEWEDDGDGPYAWWGSELAYIKAFKSKYPDRPLRIIKLTAGGSQLASTGDGNWDWMPTSTGELFDNGKNYYDAAIAAIEAEGFAPSIRSVFWSQGETDVSDHSASYRANLETFIAALRSQWGIGNCPFVISRMESKAFPQNITIRNGQLNIAVKDTAAFVVETNALATTDGTHFNAASLATIGDRWFGVDERTYTPALV